jgi:hypothetical protein
VLASKHGKAAAIAPALADMGLTFGELPPFDTDRFGSFIREATDTGNQRAALLAKAAAACELADNIDYVVTSEGTFGPHPKIPSLPGGLEMVALFDRRNGRAVVGRDLTLATNFAQAEVRSWKEVQAFADRIGFPSHGLVVRAARDKPAVATAVIDRAELAATVRPLIARAGRVWLESDMRAHVNPTRMRAIAFATDDLIRRLLARCPACDFPDWTPRLRQGRPCGECSGPTIEAWVEAHSCANCGHHTERCIDPGRRAEPGHCTTCGPAGALM